MSQLKGRIAMVTGAGSGLGRASARALAARGACVAVADLNDEAAGETVALITGAGGEACAVHIDICSEEKIKAATEAVVRKYGRLDILHNNAAYAPGHVLANDIDILTISTQNWDMVMQGTLRGTMLGCRYGVIEMLKTGGGSIINTSSMYGVSAFNQMPAYGVSKAAINMLTQNVATAYGRKGIRCNAVAPSMIRTPMLEGAVPEAFITMNADATLVGYLGIPEDIGNIVAWLASDDARYITGQVIHADGGSTAHLPTYADARRFFGEV
jgi:NAD(P)-dependent dehydrogenase (short-subunit alcohol dehydrogenase family)